MKEIEGVCVCVVWWMSVLTNNSFAEKSVKMMLFGGAISCRFPPRFKVTFSALFLVFVCLFFSLFVEAMLFLLFSAFAVVCGMKFAREVELWSLLSVSVGVISGLGLDVL